MTPSIAPASEVGVTPHDRGSNTVILQISVPDVGTFTDPEGNLIWVVDDNCP